MRKLGRGLSELGLNELLSGAHSSATEVAAVSQSDNEKLRYLSVNSISPGQFQPRKYMDPEGLTELADSIREQGILQPIIVRPAGDNRYEIIAGERRWRAAKLANLSEIPVIIREVSNQTAVAFALIENIQRRDLNSIEEAQALQRLLQEFNLTHEAVAQAVGKSRVAVTNLLRLLQLSDEVKTLLIEGKIQKGHAMVLLTLEHQAQKQLAQQIITEGLSVRQTEDRVHTFQNQTPISKKNAPSLNNEMHQLQSNLSEKLAAKVMIRHNAKGQGKIVINYHNLEELSGILAHIQ